MSRLLARAGQLFSLRRWAAELVALTGYRRLQSLYWKLRARDMSGRYRYREDHPVLAKLIRDNAVASVLDIGCGFGRLFEAYAEAGIEKVYALEISGELCAQAALRSRELAATHPKTVIEVTRSDLRDPLPPSTLPELVVSNRVLQHVHPDDIAQVIARLAAPGPRLIYVNELLKGPVRSAYTFVHPYEKLLVGHGYQLVARGMIPGLGHDYLVFRKAGAQS
jgi:SAM-dependent methyltransferase